MKRVQRGHVTLKWYEVSSCACIPMFVILTFIVAGISVVNRGFDPCGKGIVAESMQLCMSY